MVADVLDMERYLGTAMPTQHGIGVLAPFDFALDRELWRWMPSDVSLHLTRLPFVPVPVTVQMATLLGDADAVHRATRDVLAPEPRVVAFNCNSASFVGGPEGEHALVQTMLEAGAPAAVTTSGALIDACRMLGVRRLAIATPYLASITERLLRFLLDFDIEPVSAVDLGLNDRIWRVSYPQIVAVALAADRPDADAVFLACTNLPTYDLISPLERMLGKPVLTANQVTMWAVLRAMHGEAQVAEQGDQRLVQASRLSAA